MLAIHKYQYRVSLTFFSLTIGMFGNIQFGRWLWLSSCDQFPNKLLLLFIYFLLYKILKTLRCHPEIEMIQQMVTIYLNTDVLCHTTYTSCYILYSIIPIFMAVYVSLTTLGWQYWVLWK